jgi:hypothetical protein
LTKADIVRAMLSADLNSPLYLDTETARTVWEFSDDDFKKIEAAAFMIRSYMDDVLKRL